MARGIAVEELVREYSSYEQAVHAISKQVEQGLLVPVKSSGTNGKRPALYQRYQKVRVSRDKSALRKEILEKILPPCSPSFYLSHPGQFEKDRNVIETLCAYLNDPATPERLQAQVSLNERSFEIFQDEKLLQEKGLRILDNLQLDLASLACYETSEPLGVFSLGLETGQNVLFCENLDPYVSMQKCMEQVDAAAGTILGMPVTTLIYGAGHRVERGIRDLARSAMGKVLSCANTLYYWGIWIMRGSVFMKVCRNG